MKKFLKSIAVVLLIAMQFTTSVSFAESENFKEEFLNNLGIIKMDENYDSDAPISRIEFLKTVLKMEKLDKLKVTGSDMQPFFDVTENDEIFNTVNLAYSLGIVKGGTDGCFRPNATISKEEMATILLRTIADGNIVDAAGGVDTLANALGLYKGLGNHIVCTQKDAAIMIYNALTAEGIEKQLDGTYRLNGYSSVMGNLYDIKYATGIVDGNYKKSIYNDDPTEYNSITLNGITYKLSEEKYNDMYFGQRITIYYTENSIGERVQVYVEEKRNSVSELDFEDVISLDSEELVYQKAESKNSVEKKLSKSCVTILNNSRANLIGNFDVSGNGNLVAIDNDNDGDIDVLDITTYDLYLAKNASAVYNRLTFKNSDKVIELNDYAYCRIIDVSGNEVEIGSITQDSVVEISISKDERFITIKVVNKRTTFKIAQISKKSGNDYLIIKSDDGIEYRTVRGFDEKLGARETITFALDSKGNICFKVMQSDNLYKLGYVMGVAMPENPMYNEGMVKILGTDEVIQNIVVPAKVKCLNTNGKVSSVQALTDMQSSQVIRFSEKEGVLTAFEIASDDENYEGLHKIAKLGNGNNIDTQYWKDAALIGGKIPVDSDTVIILTDLTKDSTDEKAYSFIAMSALGDEQYYPDTVGYRVGNSDIHSDIVISPYDKPLTKNAPILLISEVYKEYDAETDTVKVVLEGYNKNEIKKLVLYENELLTYTTVDGKEIELGAGDCIRYVINSKDEIKKVKLMFDYSDMKMYGINDGDDLSYAYGAKELHRTGQVASVHGDYVKLLIDGVGAEDYLYSLKTAELYQVSEKNGQTLCEAISSYDIMSLKNNPELKDKVFTMLVYGDTRVFVIYKADE